MTQLANTRIDLRKFVETDWEAFYKLNSSEIILKYHFEAGKMKNEEQIKDDFNSVVNNNSKEKTIWAVTKKNNDEVIGLSSLYYKNIENEWHIGFRIIDSEWNKGYATEVLSELINISLKNKITKLYALVNVGNMGSERVLLKNSFKLINKGIYNDWEMEKYELNINTKGNNVS
jgi:ribosomal-protein-alanine N-acetyltransferase